MAKIKKEKIAIPQFLEEAEQLVVQIRELENQIEKIHSAANKAIADREKQINDIKKQAKADTKPFENKLQILAKAVFAFAQSHREELLADAKKKTIELSTGDKLRWYFTKGAITFDDEEEAIAELKEKGITDGIRTIEEVNKAYLLEHRGIVATLETINFEQEEIFAIILEKLSMSLEKQKRDFKKVVL